MDAARNYVEEALAYARWAADPDNPEIGKWQRLAVRKFLREYEECQTDGRRWDWSDWHANDVCDFIEKLPHVEGEQGPIQLAPWQVWYLVALFGFRRRGTQLRRFTTAVLLVARKNGKSTLLGGILLYCLTCEGEVGPQVYTAATTGEQAGIVFSIAKRMVQMTPDLADHFHLVARAKGIGCFLNGGTLQPLNAKATTKDGLNPYVAAFDEFHALKTRDLYDVLTSAAGARKAPLFFIITTEGYENTGPWSSMRKQAMDVLAEVVELEHVFAALYMIDDDDDELDPAVWPKANPLLRHSETLRMAIEKQAAEAKVTPEGMAEFRIKRVNRPSSTASGWVNLQKWNACSHPPDLAALTTRRARLYAALDLSVSTDLCSLRGVWRTDDGYLNTIARRWIPQRALKTRTQRGAHYFDKYVADGLLDVCEGEVIDYGKVREAVLEWRDRFDLALLLVDPWNATELSALLLDDGVTVEKFRQNFGHYHPAMSDLERVYLSGKLRHGGDRLLRWNAANLVASRDDLNNVKPSKKRSADKIDDMCALIMANGGLVANLGEADWNNTITQPLKVRVR